MSRANRIRWRCRRGMLELDLILLQFFDTHYAQLPAAEQQTFEALLQLQDDALLTMISGEEVGEPRFANLLGRLRQCCA